MKELLIMQLNKKIADLAKKHCVDKDQIKITYEDYQLYYYVTKGVEVQKIVLDI
jgi:hypothetical protein